MRSTLRAIWLLVPDPFFLAMTSFPWPTPGSSVDNALVEVADIGQVSPIRRIDTRGVSRFEIPGQDFC